MLSGLKKNSLIKYSIPQKCFISIKVYDLLGRELATLVDEEKQAGNYEVTFDGSGLTSGIYFYQFHADEFLQSKKFVLIK